MGIEEQWTSAANVLVAMITTYGMRVVGAFFILIAGWMASRLLHRAVRRVLQKSPRIDPTVALFLGNAARYFVLVFTFIAVLTTFGIATTSFVAVVGAMGLAIGLALQGTLSNFAAGIMLVMFRPFHVGDRIETSGVSGTTREINLFFTEVDMDDNVRVVIPNGKLWGEIVRVPTRNDTARLDLLIPRPANDDVSATFLRVRNIIEQDARVQRIDRIGIEDFNDDGYTLAAHIWIKRADATAMRFDLNRSIKEEFDLKLPAAAVERRAG